MCLLPPSPEGAGPGTASPSHAPPGTPPHFFPQRQLGTYRSGTYAGLETPAPVSSQGSANARLCLEPEAWAGDAKGRGSPV